MSKGNNSKEKKKRVKIGDVLAIPLPNGKYAFGRIFKNSYVAYYKKIGENINDIPTTEDYQFIVATYQYLTKGKIWEAVERRPYSTDDEVTAPPNSIYNQLTKQFSIYYKGETRPASLEECRNLEPMAVWDKEHIIDRLIGNNKWTESMQITNIINQMSQ